MFYYLQQNEILFENYQVFINASNSIISGGFDRYIIDASNYMTEEEL